MTKMSQAQLLRLREIKRAPVELDQVHLDGTFSGYASVFGEVDQGNDAVMAGAFRKTVSKRSASGIRMLFQHDPDKPVGAWHDIHEDRRGLRVSGRIATATETGRDVLELMRAGAVDGLSIGFRTVRARTDARTGIRHILEADLWEVSIVTFPMLESARIESIKAADKAARTPQLPAKREFEKWLMQDAGLTRKEARLFLADGYSALSGTQDAAGVPKSGLVGKIRQATTLFS